MVVDVMLGVAELDEAFEVNVEAGAAEEAVTSREPTDETPASLCC